MSVKLPLLCLLPLVLACTGQAAEDDDGDSVEAGVPALGYQSGGLEAVELTVIGTEADGLNVPRDLDFNPDRPHELWVVNRKDDSTTTFWETGTDEQTSRWRKDPFAQHFMEEVSSIAFGGVTWSKSEERTFGTCQESQNTYNDRAEANDFMGPTLWTSDAEYYAESNPDAVEFLTELYGFPTDLGSHLDMLHESPLCMGIEYGGEANHFWVFDGFNQSIAFNDFALDHDPGYDDHGDGIILKYVMGEVERVEDVPSHLVLDQDSGLLYVADTGNNRIAVLDTLSGEDGGRLPVWEAGTYHRQMVNADFFTLVDGEAVGRMDKPSGIDLVDGILLVTDNEWGDIMAFDLEGNLVDRLELGVGSGALMGIKARSLEEIFLVDAKADEVLRITAK